MGEDEFDYSQVYPPQMTMADYNLEDATPPYAPPESPGNYGYQGNTQTPNLTSSLDANGRPYITNIPQGGNWYDEAAKSYNSNPLAAQSPDGGPAYRQMAPQASAAPQQSQAGGNNQQLMEMLKALGSGTYQSQNQPQRQVNPQAAQQMGKPYAGSAAPFVSGYQQTAGQMPNQLMTMYQQFLQNPQSYLDSPIFKAIQDTGLQATERAQLAKGGNGSGGMAQELQKTGQGLAGGFLDRVASMMQGGAQLEGQRYGQQASANINAGNLGLNAYQQEANSQMNNARANYGINQDSQAQDYLQQSQAQNNPVQQLMTMLMMKQLSGG